MSRRSRTELGFSVPTAAHAMPRLALWCLALTVIACQGRPDAVAVSHPAEAESSGTPGANPSTSADPAESFEPPAVPFSDFGDSVLSVGGSVIAPVKQFWPKPKFPPGVEQLRGQVVLQSIIGADGTISRIRVDKTLHPAYDGECVGALQQWRFEPARLNGRAVNVYFRLTVNFIPRKRDA